MPPIQSLTIVVLLSCPALAQEWTEFRGPTGQGHASSRPPIEWDSQQNNLLWKCPLPGTGWSSPVIQNGLIFLTAAVPIVDSKDLSLQLIVIDLKTGTVENQIEVFRQTADNAPEIHSKNSHASPTPVIENDHIYVHFGHQGTACINTDGETVWKNRNLEYAPVHGNGGSPILFQDLLIFSCDGGSDPFIAALDKGTGKLIWRKQRESDADRTFSFSTPLVIEVNGQPQLISPGSNSVWAYNPRDGREIWHVNYEGYSVIPRPVFGHGLVFLGTGYDSPKVLAIRPDGKGDVTDSHVAWTLSRGAPHTPSMLLIEDHLYMVSDRGIATCVDAKTGEEKWQERIGGNFSASPLYANGSIYLQSEAGECIVIDGRPEFKEVARNDLDERSLASFAVAGDSLLIRTAEHLFRIGRK
ncbi:MAG: PQQ-binding-like beta-propeller repeat protein [Pirellulaceae bacterium]|nr:PQQ-binding-like beta-propeller repeat protein [Pirellulaceae bacterium]